MGIPAGTEAGGYEGVAYVGGDGGMALVTIGGAVARGTPGCGGATAKGELATGGAVNGVPGGGSGCIVTGRAGSNFARSASVSPC